MPRDDNPFKVLEKINDNAYKVDLLGDYAISTTFNVADLRPYVQDDYLADLRLKSSQQGEDDGGPLGQPNLEIQIIEESPHFPIKVQEMTHILLRS